MKIIMLETKLLVPYENNPRNNNDAVEYVANSIKEFGFKVPIIVDKDNVIIAGHTRHKAALILGIDKIPCIIADDLSNEQIRAFRLADNKVAEIAVWDDEMLKDELSSLSELEIDMCDFGFEIDESVELEIDDEDIGEGVRFEHTMKIDNTTIILTDDEYQSLMKRLDTYVDENGVSFGFVGELLCNM